MRPGAGGSAVRVPVVFALLRRVLRFATWYAFGTLIAGGVLWMGWREPGDATGTALRAAVLLAPGLVLVHFTRTVASLPARLRLGTEPLARASLLRLGVGLTYLLRPWYWSLVALCAAAGLVMMPLAVIAALTGL